MLVPVRNAPGSLSLYALAFIHTRNVHTNVRPCVRVCMYVRARSFVFAFVRLPSASLSRFYRHFHFAARFVVVVAVFFTYPIRRRRRRRV